MPNKAKKPLVSISPWLELEKQSQMIWRISNLEMFPFAQRFETWGAESRSDEPDEATRSVPARKGKTSAWKQARLQHRLGHRRQYHILGVQPGGGRGRSHGALG